MINPDKIITSFKLFEDSKDKDSDLNQLNSNLMRAFEDIFSNSESVEDIINGLDRVEEDYNITLYRCEVIHYNGVFEQDKQDDLKRLAKNIYGLLSTEKGDINIELSIDTPPKSNKKRIYKIKVK